MSETAGPGRIRVLIADDHGAIRVGLRLMLESANDIVVVGEASDGATAIRQATALRPDVVLMDVRMPGLDGIAATERIVRAALSRVLILTTFDVDEYVFGALRAGAGGFLLKTVESPALIDAVRRLAAGESVVAPEVLGRVLEQFVARDYANKGGSDGNSAAPGASPLLANLTPRELEIVTLIARGQSNLEIAATLTIAPTTAKTHVSRVLGKLDCTSRLQAAIIAREAGLV